MKIIKKKERGYRFYSEKYDLNGSYAGQGDLPIGVLLLYVLVRDSDIKFRSLSAEAEGELGEPHNLLNVNDLKLFSSPKKLADAFIVQDLFIWELTASYDNIEIFISGRTYGTVLSVRSPLNKKVNVLPLMNHIENCTYNYNGYDISVIERIKKRFNMNQKITIQTIMKMEKHEDIFQEFIQGIYENPFGFPNSSAVSVEGYTAKQLFDNYPLSELGAYNYLIYLRETPKDALSDLRKGLPRK